jgi:hypothetical protein
MKKIRKTLFIIPIFICSCSSPYLKNYEPINIFLETEKIDSIKYTILKNKESNTQTLRIFNQNEGFNLPTRFDFFGTYDLYNKKHWTKLYNKYSKDTIKKYWEDKDFKNYNFILEERRYIFSESFFNKYPNCEHIIILSEPIFYWNKKYIMFFYYKLDFPGNSGNQKVIVMKNINKKWVIEKIFYDY